MFSSPRAFLVLALLVAGLAFVGRGAGPADAASAAPPPTTAPVLADLNRADCDTIRGTDYLSDEERGWFLTYCLGGSAASSQTAPQVVYVYVPVPQTAAAASIAPSKPVAPSVRISCTSSQGTAVASDDLQNPSLNAFANEPIYCAASVNGSYTSIDWAAGSNNGSSLNFITSFGYRTLPWTIRVQLNWGGNPIIHNFSVTTLSSGCLLPGYQIC